MIDLPGNRTLADALGLYAWLAYRDALLEARGLAAADKASGGRSGVFRDDPWQLAGRLGFDIDEDGELGFIPISRDVVLQVSLAAFADEAQLAAGSKVVVPPIELSGSHQYILHQDTWKPLVCRQAVDAQLGGLVDAAVAWIRDTPAEKVVDVTGRVPTVADLVLAATRFDLWYDLEDQIWEDLSAEIGLHVDDNAELIVPVPSSWGQVVYWGLFDRFQLRVYRQLGKTKEKANG